MSNPRQEFVEAMRDIIGVTTNEPVCVAACRSACIAFADAACRSRGCYIRVGESVNHPCRAALLRECGLEEHGG